MDFLQNRLMKGVTTQGREHSSQQWVTNYYVQYRVHGSETFETVKDSSNQFLVSIEKYIFVITFFSSLSTESNFFN